MQQRALRGSVLVYTLTVLALLLSLGLSLAAVSQSQTRSAISTDESVIAYFLAESGAEDILDKVYGGAYNSQTFNDFFGASSCANGVLTQTLSTGTWTATFYKVNGDQITNCSDAGWRTEVDQVKVDGNHSGSIRSIRVSIRPAV
jgi:Tfp pilus assembly protein PilX